MELIKDVLEEIYIQHMTMFCNMDFRTILVILIQEIMTIALMILLKLFIISKVIKLLLLMIVINWLLQLLNNQLVSALKLIN